MLSPKFYRNMDLMLGVLGEQTKKVNKTGGLPPVDRLPQEYIIILTNI
jgi:hypothetical protein